MLWWLHECWDWFWYYRRGKIKYKIWNEGTMYNITASNGKMTCYNCRGTTIERAKEMALYRLNMAMNRNPNKLHGFTLNDD